ncbi:MAG: tetratricopeptide repeat protein [Hydrogenophaga sp.]|uniref:tetratricopeptide repeat protein n=1 Tax=Hydrogenophaga sp. TaxID=1904254 RepID=UPI002764E62E|nr:tetratricopeptide repeat protein [Hydrogenophaga sp.]MDP1524185.1 tetratricopeptide repeat protein [Rhodocyclaceae bacterium]MDZ4187345.1 tetratricopeptide repeat protein [Hydrogenophaga sp.]
MIQPQQQAHGLALRMGQAFASFLLLACLTALAEPRPEPYSTGADVFSETRQALQSQQWLQALDALRQLSRVMPEITDDAEFHNLMGYSLRQASPSHLGAAVDHYQQALRLEPAHVQARAYLGQAYLMQGRPDLAREQLQHIEHLCKGQACETWRDLQRAIQTQPVQR